MMGLSDKVGSIIQNARVYELDLSKRYRSFFAYMTILGSFLMARGYLRPGN
jgi:ATP-binding cassette subfamily C (CFTR/MRP) protein 1